MDKRIDKSFLAYQKDRIDHWNKIAHNLEHGSGWGKYYHSRLEEIYHSNIPSGQQVLEIGCGEGDLLACLEPKHGVGIDFSSEMIKHARLKHPNLHFIVGDAHSIKLNNKFDAIILSDLLNDVWDVQVILENLQGVCKPETRLFINIYSKVWWFPIKLAELLKLVKPNLTQNWLTVNDITNLLALSNFEIIRHQPEILLPLPIPILKSLCNKFLVRYWFFNYFAISNFIVAKPTIKTAKKDVSVSVIVPARNEAGNIKNIIDRIPPMGNGTEIIFVEGHSKDSTYETIKKTIKEYPEKNIHLFQQLGTGKGDAVRLGFQQAKGEILMILDADLTVQPEDLPRFYNALLKGYGEFINGIRLVYPMEKEAMRFLNFLGNKAFSLVFSWLLGQNIKDTLCGTKALYRSNYEKIYANRAIFGDFDPFGDFDLLFGAAKLNLKIIDMPIRYRERTYGSTNIQRWKHGWLLIRMVFFAARRLKFI